LFIFLAAVLLQSVIFLGLGKAKAICVNTVIATIPVGAFPSLVAFDLRNGDLYVSNHESNTVSVINGATNKVIATIPVGAFPIGVAFDLRNGDLYVANAKSNSVFVVVSSC
jgi:YVTN family beta-propeller protein